MAGRSTVQVDSSRVRELYRLNIRDQTGRHPVLQHHPCVSYSTPLPTFSLYPIGRITEWDY